MSKLVIDIETKNDFRDVGGKANIGMLTISIIGVYDYDNGSLYAYEEHEFPRFLELLRKRPTFIGYNIIGFDLPVMQANLKRIDSSINLDAFPRVDLMFDIAEHIGHRIGLDTVSKATLGTGGKSGSGMDAITFWKEGRIEELKSYCLKDVDLTREVYEYGQREGRVWFEGWQRKYSVPVKWN